MSKVVFISLLIMSSYFGFSQNEKVVSVEKSTFGIQVGLIGIWAHNELKVSDQVALRSELAVSGINSASISPLLALESRWYYNLNERVNKGKRIDGNSGDYISLRSSYHFHDATEIEENDINRILLVPTWGIRRNISTHFNYEIGGGAGFGYRKDVALAFYVNLRIGYRF